MKRTPTGPVIAEMAEKKYSSDSLIKAISQQSSTTSERSREYHSESEMSYTDADEDSFSNEEQSIIIEEVKSKETPS